MRRTGSGGELHRPERRLVERDLLLAADLVGQLFPRGCNIVGAGLRVVPVPVGNLNWLAVDRESGDAVVQ